MTSRTNASSAAVRGIATSAPSSPPTAAPATRAKMAISAGISVWERITSGATMLLSTCCRTTPNTSVTSAVGIETVSATSVDRATAAIAPITGKNSISAAKAARNAA